MTVDRDTMLSHYRLIEKIGEGGMGVVWRAVDTNLDREVAIKVLPGEVAADSERLSRFEREAKLLAALNHPNIATVHGLHEAGGIRFLAMELAAGEDLSRRLSRGALSIDDSMRIGLQIAEAVEAAHDSGVIHRDLKPANIQIAPDGAAKVLDFGLAKAFEVDPTAAGNPSQSPTMTSAQTQAGVILGTAAYMSPEQAKGDVVDKRADIWAFGVVLLEMLTGRQTFKGNSIAETLALVITASPQWEQLPKATPPQIRRLLRRCLAKDPRRRLRDIGDARIAIAEVQSGEADDAVRERFEPGTPHPSWKRILPWGLTALLAVAFVGSWALRPSAPANTGRAAGSVNLSAVLPDDELLFMANLDLELMPALTISPSGDRVVYAARADQDQTIKERNALALRVRELSGFDTELLRGTENVEIPFFSPDGRWIGFFDGRALAKVPATGGARVTLVEGIGNGVGASWGADGTIVFAHSYVGPLWTVSDSGGEARPVTTLAARERSHRFPQLLPDGRSVIFTIKTEGILTFDDASIAIADLRTGKHRVLLEGGCYARYVPSGHLVYAREGGLLAAPFDLDSLSITGGAVPVLDDVITNFVTGAAQLDVSNNGTLVYVKGDYSGPTTLSGIDRDTGAREVLAPGHYAALPHLSPDGQRLLMHGSAANDHVLSIDLTRGTVARMTDASTNNILPIWGPEGKRIIFTTDRSGQEEIVSMPADGGEITQLVPPRGPPQEAYSFSPDGKIMTINSGVRSSRDIWIFDTEGDREARPFLETPFDEGDAVFSPDGRWITYSSNESGTLEIYAKSYLGPGGKFQLSTGGGFYPHWRVDGAELYYQTNTALMVVPVSWTPEPRPGRPQVMAEISSVTPLGYDVSPDGKRFYVVELDVDRWQSNRLDVVLNWFEELKRLVPRESD
jgi:serine/threonine-protein kinase